MKRLLALVLIVLLLAIALPIAGMEGMGDCPMCTSPRTIPLGICAGIGSLFILLVLLRSSRLRLREETCRAFLLSPSIYRPPRAA